MWQVGTLSSSSRWLCASNVYMGRQSLTHLIWLYGKGRRRVDEMDGHLGELEQVAMRLGLVHGHGHLAHLARLLHELRILQGHQRNANCLHTAQLLVFPRPVFISRIYHVWRSEPEDFSSVWATFTLII